MQLKKGGKMQMFLIFAILFIVIIIGGKIMSNFLEKTLAVFQSYNRLVDLETTAKDTETKVTTFDSDVIGLKNESATLRNSVTDLKNNFHSFDKRNVSILDKLSKEVNNNNINTIQAVGSLKSDLKMLDLKIGLVPDEILKTSEDIQNNLKILEQKMNNAELTLKDSIRTNNSHLEKSIDSNNINLKEAIDSNNSNLKDSIKSNKSYLQNSLEQHEKYFEKCIEINNELINSKLGSEQKIFSINVTNLEKNLIEKIEALESEILSLKKEIVSQEEIISELQNKLV